jgi:hypothetical protein
MQTIWFLYYIRVHVGKSNILYNFHNALTYHRLAIVHIGPNLLKIFKTNCKTILN